MVTDAGAVCQTLRKVPGDGREKLVLQTFCRPENPLVRARVQHQCGALLQKAKVSPPRPHSADDLRNSGRVAQLCLRECRC